MTLTAMARETYGPASAEGGGRASGSYDQKQDPRGFLESLLTRETGCSPAGPSLSTAPPDGVEQGMAGQDRAGRGQVGSGRG